MAHCLYVSTVLLLSTSAVASAAFTMPSWTRPASSAEAAASNTTYQLFDVFSDDDSDPSNGVLDTAPDVANFNPSGSASVASTVGFITGSGNLYNPSAVIDVLLTLPNPNLGSQYTTKFLLQVQSQGNPWINTSPAPDFSLFTINGQPLADFSPTHVELSRVPGGPLGAIVDHAVTFSVPGNASSYAIAWQPAGTSVSHRMIAVDTLAVVPEPASLAVCSFAGGLLLARRRRLPCRHTVSMGHLVALVDPALALETEHRDRT